MNDDERLDLSSLDPLREPAHWYGFVAATLLRADAPLARRAQDPLSLIASWTRPMLAAAATTLVLLVPVEVTLERREARAEQVDRLVALSSAWDGSALPPSGADFVRALANPGPS